MNIIAIFILGMLIGWIAEWILDWFYWRGRIHKAASENDELKERIISLEEELNKRPDQFITTPLINRSGRDNLQAIHGIGPAFSKRLNDAGINTFEQLSQLTPAGMEKILGTLFKRFYSQENTIIEQAKEFAEQKAKSG
jgi:predicted flap endonuclease-1-like 5' DNA nuclease